MKRISSLIFYCFFIFPGLASAQATNPNNTKTLSEEQIIKLAKYLDVEPSDNKFRYWISNTADSKTKTDVLNIPVYRHFKLVGNVSFPSKTEIDRAILIII